MKEDNETVYVSLPAPLIPLFVMLTLILVVVLVLAMFLFLFPPWIDP
jgi:hypothetical protein